VALLAWNRFDTRAQVVLKELYSDDVLGWFYRKLVRLVGKKRLTGLLGSKGLKGSAVGDGLKWARVNGVYGVDDAGLNAMIDRDWLRVKSSDVSAMILDSFLVFVAGLECIRGHEIDIEAWSWRGRAGIVGVGCECVLMIDWAFQRALGFEPFEEFL
jgi:hypothetical protein